MSGITTMAHINSEGVMLRCECFADGVWIFSWLSGTIARVLEISV